MTETIDLTKVSELVDMLNIFEKEYVFKVLERRDAMWDKRRGVFNDPKEAAIYEDTRLKGEFLVHLHGSMKQLISCVAISTEAMEDYANTIDSMQMIENNNFREQLFTEQRTEMMRLTDKFKKILDFNTGTYKEITK